jgi:hypothetical protein
VSRALSLPHEHGGYLTIAGAAAAGVALAPARGAALAVGGVVAAAFFARAPLEQLARGRGARLDRGALALLSTIALAGALALGGGWAAIALAVAGAIVTASLVARDARWQRTSWFETLGMAALGASAGLAALAGGCAPGVAVALAIVVAAHTGLAVPLVRAEVRPRERAGARRAGAVALVVLAVAAGTLAVAGLGGASLALAPRALHALARVVRSPQKMSPNLVGVRESVMLALVVALLVATAR